MSLRLILISLGILPLSACATSPNSSLVKQPQPHQIYLGYPCFDACPAFKAGYDLAKTQQYTSASQCQTLPPSQQNGCKSYVNDILVSTVDNGGLYLQAN